LNEQETARFIIATSSAIVTGLILAEAISVTFWEVEFNAHTMAQCWCRHVRQGNKNKKFYSFLIIAKGNTTEQRILEHNKMKERIQEATKRMNKQAVLESGQGAKTD
jgi:hypothetical protein